MLLITVFLLTGTQEYNKWWFSQDGRAESLPPLVQALPVSNSREVSELAKRFYASKIMLGKVVEVIE